jgi:hypothetical protein
MLFFISLLNLKLDLLEYFNTIFHNISFLKEFMNLTIEPLSIGSSAAAVAETSSHQELGAIFHEAKTLLTAGDQKGFETTLCKIGVAPDCKAMHEIIQKIFTQSVAITASIEVSGVLFLKEETEANPFAVFKLGRKRANHELFAFHLSKLLHLDQHALPGCFCAVSNPLIPTHESLEAFEVVEELFNMGSKEMLLTKENPEGHIIGILEPYIEAKAAASSDDLANFAKMILLCLALGLRDVKKDGQIDSCLIDLEECMPAVLDPVDKDDPFAIPATDLAILESELATQTLPESLQAELKTLVGTWNLDALVGFISSIPILHKDVKAERLLERHDGKKRLDDGHNKFIFHQFENRSIFGRPLFSGYSKKAVEETKLFDPRQIGAFITRMSRIIGFITTAKDYTVLDLVFAVDPFYHESVETLRACCEGSSDELLMQLKRIQVHAIAGHFNPTFIREKAKKK